ncbi:MAG: DUF4360 domain-containing protein [Pseudobdellovibrio sp.]
MKNILVILSSLAVSIFANAQVAQVGAITAGGSGCVGSNIRVSANTSGQVTIAYPQMQIQPDNKTRVVRTTCAVAVPVSIPAGFQLIASVRTTGLARLQKNDKVTVSQELFTAGTVGKKQTVDLTPANTLFSIGKLSATDALAKSECGKDAILRLNVSATAIKATELSQSKLAVNKSQIQLKLVSCN